jgi:hypothetical protein
MYANKPNTISDSTASYFKTNPIYIHKSKAHAGTVLVDNNHTFLLTSTNNDPEDQNN